MTGVAAARPVTAAGTGVFADLHRPEPLDTWFGDPTDPDNPLGYAAFLAADERGDLLPAGERVLDRYLLNAEFVPPALGGRLDRVDRLGRLLRPLFRRDAALALGHGASNLVGAVDVWAGGSPEQQRWLAGLMLDNGRVAAAYTDLEAGNDVARSGLRAVRAGDGWLLRGGKDVVNNIGRAEAVTLLARTADEPGSRSHSLMLLDRASLPAGTIDLLPRFRTAGVRAMYLGGIRLRDCPVPGSVIVGAEGGALETMLRAFQLTSAVLPAAALGGMDAALRTVVDFAVGRQLYGRAVIELPHARAVLAGAFLDLLICDSLATVTCRALHLLPGQTPVLAPAVKYLVPLLLRDAMEDLGVILGARSFLRDGPPAIFQKHLRDLPVATLVHGGATVCQAKMIPQLPRQSRRWLTGTGTEPAVFELDAALPELDLPGLSVLATGADPVLAALWTVRDEVGAGSGLRAGCDALLAELAELKREYAGLGPRELSPLASAETFTLSHRYAVLLAAAACLGVWYHNPAHPSAFIRDEGWLTAALYRLAGRLGRTTGGAPDLEPVTAELLARHAGRRAFDLIGRAVT